MLSPYRVLDLTDHGAMLAGQILGDLGADVILVEPPGGAEFRRHGPFWQDQEDPARSLTFWSFNRDKRSVTLDLDTPEGCEQLRDLVRTADFLIESYAPGYLAARGLGYDALAAINPRLVMVSVTPFGQTGPKAGWAATDLTAWAASRVMMMTGDADRPPLGLSVPQAFLHAGAEAAVGALVAHAARERDGVGQHVDISAQSATGMASQATILDHAWGAPETTRMAGGVNFGGIPLRFVNPARDGFVSVTFLFGSAIGPFTRRLMEVIHDEGFVDAATRDKDWLGYTVLLASGKEPLSEYLRCCDAIAAFTSRHTKAELFRMGMEKDLLIVPVSSVEDLVASPQLAARKFWADVPHDELGTTVRYPGVLAKFSRTPLTPPRRPPLPGEHTDQVLAERRQPRTPSGTADAPAGHLPLAGVNVLDIMWVIAGPWGVRYLSDYGATVIKIDSTTRIDTARTIGPFKDGQPGPERSAAWATVNAGKLGLTLSLSNPASRPVLDKLVKWADIVTDSFTPGTMKKLGLDYESLRKINPGIIMVSSCLNGQTGPYASLAGFGTMGAQLAGFGLLAGWPDRSPAGPAGAYTDYIAPKFTAAAVLAALDHRRRTGEGQYIDLSQSEASSAFLGPALLDFTVNGRVRGLHGNDIPEYFPHGVYPARGDERWVAIVVANTDQWRALCGAIGQPGWAADPAMATVAGRRAAGPAIDAAITAWTSARDVDAIEQVLQAVGVPCHRAATSVDALADPQLAHRQHFLTVEHPEHGPVVIENSRMLFSRTPAQVTRPGPTFGQDNDHVLREILGLDDEQIVELIAAGALE